MTQPCEKCGIRARRKDHTGSAKCERWRRTREAGWRAFAPLKDSIAERLIEHGRQRGWLRCMHVEGQRFVQDFVEQALAQAELDLLPLLSVADFGSDELEVAGRAVMERWLAVFHQGPEAVKAELAARALGAGDASMDV